MTRDSEWNLTKPPMDNVKVKSNYCCVNLPTVHSEISSFSVSLLETRLLYK